MQESFARISCNFIVPVLQYSPIPFNFFARMYILGKERYHIFADMPISTSVDIADTDTAGKKSISAPFLIADTDTAVTEKCADMPIIPTSILVSAHPYSTYPTDTLCKVGLNGLRLEDIIHSV